MSKRRVASSLLLVTVLISTFLAMAPAAFAARPFMARFEPTTTVIPAGFGCAFDVQEEPIEGSFALFTEFDDGRFAIVAHADVIVTNVETGSNFYHRARFHGVEQYNPETGLVDGLTTGQVLFWLSPGDQGPYGIIEEPGLFQRFEGAVRYAYDPNTEAMIEISYVGTATDVCALLSE